MMITRSFGGSAPIDVVPGDAGEMPTPVLHVGEVHAELRLNITDATLRELGAQIRDMIADAARQGLEDGVTAAMGEAVEDPTGQGALFAGQGDPPPC